MSPRHRVALAILALLAIVAPARGQGTSGTLPPPISSGRLATYAERLGLSAQQLRAFESLHDTYSIDFRVLREGEIADFLVNQRAAQGGVPEIDIVADMLRDLERLRTKIKILDNRLFDQLVPMLSETQVARLRRVKLSRERERYRTQQAQVQMGRGSADLGDLLHEVRLTDAAREAADPIIERYERRLTALMRRQSDEATVMTLELMEILDERGFSNISPEAVMADPELLQRLLDELKVAFNEVNEDVKEINAEIADLNRTTCRQAVRVMPPDDARRFSNTFHREAYGELAAVVRMLDRDWMHRAGELEDITATERETLLGASETYARRLDTLLAQGTRIVDDFWANFSPFDMGARSGQTLRGDLRELAEEAAAVEERTQRDLAAALGGERLEVLRQAASNTESARLAQTEGSTGGAMGAGDDDTDDTITWTGDTLVPGAMPRRTLDAMARRADLDAAEREVALAVHASYLARYDALDEITSVAELNTTIRAATDGLEGAADAADLVTSLDSARRRAIAAIEPIDAMFFDELLTALGPGHQLAVERLRLTRQLAVHSGTASTRLSLGEDRSGESTVDLAALVDRLELDDDTRKRLEPWLVEHFRSRLDTMRMRFETQLELQALTDQWLVEVGAAANEDIAAVVALQSKYRDVVVEPTRRSDDAGAALAAGNRATLETLLGELPRDVSRRLRDAYDRAAFPTVFDDPSSPVRQIDAARALGSLAPAQRQQLDDLVLEYRPAYDALSQAMIEHVQTDRMNIVGIDTEDFNAWQEREQQMATIRYDRNELNARAISRLRNILTADQIAAVGGLPEPDDVVESIPFRR